VSWRWSAGEESERLPDLGRCSIRP
jgi:hypothetical protein